MAKVANHRVEGLYPAGEFVETVKEKKVEAPKKKGLWKKYGKPVVATVLGLSTISAIYFGLIKGKDTKMKGEDLNAALTQQPGIESPVDHYAAGSPNTNPKTDHPIRKEVVSKSGFEGPLPDVPKTETSFGAQNLGDEGIRYAKEVVTKSGEVQKLKLERLGQDANTLEKYFGYTEEGLGEVFDKYRIDIFTYGNNPKDSIALYGFSKRTKTWWLIRGKDLKGN